MTLAVALTAGTVVLPASPAAAELAAQGRDITATRDVLVEEVVATFTDTEPGTVRDGRAFVSAAFDDLLGRAPDQSRLDFYGEPLDFGGSRVRVSAALASSAERRRRVTGLHYVDYLGRPAGGTEAAFWASAMGRGLSLDGMRAGLLGSGEYLHRAGSTPEGFVDALY